MIPPDTMPVPQDPDELFDIVDANGRAKGLAKRRADVHRDGDWHRAVHVWIMGHDETGWPFLLFQLRAAGKDTAPLRLDATVGGHLRAGESVIEALREIDEEIGIEPDLERLRFAGTRRAVVDRPPDVRDFEIQDVYLLPDGRPLAEYRPLAVELAELVRIPMPPLLALLSGERDAAPALILDSATREIREGAIHTSEFKPTIDNYFYRVAVAAHNALRGDRYIAI
jgi:isopentenyldiphosphate isomerase